MAEDLADSARGPGPAGAGRPPLDYDSLFVAEWPGVVRYLHRACSDEGLAEDLAQETFLRAAQGLAAFRGESSPRTWLRRIAANLLRDHWRRHASRPRERPLPWPPEPDLALADPGDSPTLAMERRHLRTCLEKLIAKLPPGERQALILALGDAKPPREVARALRLAPEAARARLSRARRKLAIMAAAHCTIGADAGEAMGCERRAPEAP